MLKDIDPVYLQGFVRKKISIFLNFFLLTPNCHRVTEFGQHMVFDKKTRACKKLIDFRGTANELSTCVIDCRRASKIHTEKSPTDGTTPKMSGLRYMKETLLGKRSDHAFRMVVVGDPKIKLGEIGVPYHIAERLQISEHFNTWNWNKLNACCDLKLLAKTQVHIRRRGNLVHVGFMDKLQLGDTVHRPLSDGDCVLINRPPSIHPHSLISLSVKILPLNSALSVNPLICSPLRGDFDGDCLHGYVPQSLDCRVELQELVGLNSQLINRQSGKNLLSLSHDSLTAAYLVVEDGLFLNQFQMQQLQMLCPNQLQFPAIIKAPSQHSSACLWTGKQLLSLILPSNFDYVYPSNGISIREGELITSSGGSSWLHDEDGNLFHSLIKQCQGEALDFLHAAQELLCEWLTMRGLSVSLSDLYLSSDLNSRKILIDEVSCGLREAEQLSHIRLLMVDYNRSFLCGNFEDSWSSIYFRAQDMCYEQQKSAILSQVYVSAFKQVFWDIQNLACQYSSRNNSLVAMLKAGSKGNVMKLVQHGICLGLQHALVPLSFSIPHELSCEAWNCYKMGASLGKAHNNIEFAASYVPCAVVENSFLTGLNPLECFVHSLTTRDNSFSGHAYVSGTLTRNLMFFLRDIYLGYDGTVRNAYGKRLVQFSYNDSNTSPIDNMTGCFNESANCHGPMGGHPVGSLAACAISEAAYSALDQPVSALESSSLLHLKKVLECGVKRKSSGKTASLFLSKKLGRWTYGFEYGALDVKSHLERVLFSEVVSSSKIFFSSETCNSKQISPWRCHFHLFKNIVRTKRLSLQSIIDALYMNCKFRVNSKINLPNLHITSKCCSVDETKEGSNTTFCITVAIAESSENSSVQLDTLREIVMPFLLGSLIKGLMEVNRVDILWMDHPNESKPYRGGELYLRVFMSEECNRTKFWDILMDSCLQIMDMIDWQRSHPDDIHDLTSAYGIDVAKKHFLSGLRAAICDTGKSVLLEHLLLAADCLSATGEFVALNAIGLSQQRKLTSVTSPFVQACFSNPEDCFIKAAKSGLVDNLQGSVDALSWGKIPSIGTGGHFDIIYAGRGHELAKSENIYNLLGRHMSTKVNVLDELHNISSESLAQRLCTYGYYGNIGSKNIIAKSVSRHFSPEYIKRWSQELNHILRKYPINGQLSDADKTLAMMAFGFHPRRREKIGSGAQEIKVGYHSEHDKTRCFLLVRTDGTVEDFSYHKCLHHALELIAPQKAKSYKSRWLNGTT